MVASLPIEVLDALFERRITRISYGTGKHSVTETLFDVHLVKTVGGLQVGVALTTPGGLRGSGTYFPLDEQGRADLLIYLGWLQNYVEHPHPAIQRVLRSQELIRGFYTAHREQPCQS